MLRPGWEPRRLAAADALGHLRLVVTKRWLARLAASAACLTLVCACRKRASTKRPERIRPPAQAGIFYPADADELAQRVRGFVDAAPRISKKRVRVLLAPHGGIHYSGRIAGQAFRQLDPDFSRAVIVAANHVAEIDFEGVAVDDATAYRMPGFRVPVDASVSRLLARPGFVHEPRAHAKHVIEVELPFLRAVHGDGFRIVPLIVGRLDADRHSRFVEDLARLATEKTVVVFSVDLSHDQPHARAASLDEACIAALVRSDVDASGRCSSDGTQALTVVSELGKRLGLRPRRIAYENSGDVRGDEESVVGYAAVVYEVR